MPYKSSDLFSCRNCGDCCKGYGGTFVNEQEVRAIAEYVEESHEGFLLKYCRSSGRKWILAQKPDGYCVFYDGYCSIHSVKPRMCKAWPFIESVLRDIGNWHIMAGACPGIKTDAPEAVIRACVEQELERLDQTSKDVARRSIYEHP